jgi:hypothetical protein
MSITKNEDGTYEVTLGIAEGVNQSGMLFGREVIEHELKRINEAPYPLISELGYPPTDDLDSQMVKHARLQDLHLERACGYISDLRIVEGNPPMIVGTFEPACAHGDAAIELIDQKAPVRFGMRASGLRRTHVGKEVMKVYGIITWDLISGEA